jgi:uncharacterized protein (TIGR03382 family)
MLLLSEVAVASTYTRVYSGTGDTVDTTIKDRGNDYTGGEGELAIESGDSNSAEYRALIGFPDVVGDGEGQVPLGSTLVSAELALRAVNGSQDMEDIAAASLATAWVEGEANWNDATATTQWLEPGAGEPDRLVECGKTTDANPDVTIDVSPCIEAWFDSAAPADNDGFVLWEGGDRGAVVSSSEASSAEAAPPTLTITFEAPDRDGDGYDVYEEDCDADAARHPGLGDTDCDGVDDDCDGAIDEDCVPEDTGEVETGTPDTGPVDTGPTAATDRDADRWDAAEGDCNDNDPDVYPGRLDDCDKVDSDCDGVVDEDCVLDRSNLPSGCQCGGDGAMVLVPAGLWGLGRRRRGAGRGGAPAPSRGVVSRGA